MHRNWCGNDLERRIKVILFCKCLRVANQSMYVEVKRWPAHCLPTHLNKQVSGFGKCMDAQGSHWFHLLHTYRYIFGLCGTVASSDGLHSG